MRNAADGEHLYLGDHYELHNGLATSYYLFGGRRIAMRAGTGVAYLFADHPSTSSGQALGSTRVVDTGSGRPGQQYTPWGEIVAGGANTLPTEYTYTGQREASATGGLRLLDYGARSYAPFTGRFISPDTLVPEPGNPQALNRYAYVYNNPLRYTDPSGFDPIDAAWEQEFYRVHGRTPTDQDRRDRFFSILFLGSGPNGSWTDEDWAWYHAHWEGLWKGSDLWPGAPAAGLDRFVAHLEHLASFYAPGEERLYAQAIGFIWGGVPLGHAIPAAWQMATNPGAAWAQYQPLFEGITNWKPALVDDPNPSHHYAGLFYMGYFFGPTIGYISNWLRDGSLSDRNVPDLNLGYVAVSHGAMLYDGIISMAEVGLAVSYAVDIRPGLWASDSPGSRVPWYYFQPWAR